MASILSNQSTVVAFCERGRRESSKEPLVLVYQADCLSDDNRAPFVKLLNQGEYIQTLGAIWSDAKNRLEFLDEQSPRLYAPLMFEEALARFQVSPTEETIHTISIPLMTAASFRTSQDAVCSSDPAVYRGQAEKGMIKVYTASLDLLTQKLLGRKLDKILEEKLEFRLKAIIGKVTEVAKRSLAIELPTPDWAANLKFRRASMYPDALYPMLRKGFAEEILKGLSLL